MSRRNKDKGRIGGQFVPLLHSTLDSPAWKATSHGARSLYVALKRRHPRERNVAYVSYRMAARELKASTHKIREWFAELQHYGFIVLHAHGHLGVNGMGTAPHWRLTELGATSRASAEGLFEPPTNDFNRWDGTPFDPKPHRLTKGHTSWHSDKLKNPVAPVSYRVLPPSATPPLPPSATPIMASVAPGVDIERGKSWRT